MEMNGEKSADFEAARARLFALAYRMLGSRAEAEDIVQDAWLKWHAADANELRSSAAWLTTIATHLAIDRLRHLQIERATRSGGWMPEPWIESLAPSAEDLALQAVQMSYGVMLLLERLRPEERAAFVLHEAFDCDYAEIAKIVRHHHERWDGEGYPDGVSHDEIPLISRIIAVADAYNAMTSDRPYRDAMPSRVARLRLAQAADSQFDTSVVAAFEAILAGASEEYRLAMRADFKFDLQEEAAPPLLALATA